MHSAEVPSAPNAAANGSRRFAVAWRHTIRNQSWPVGVLDYDGDRYVFEYRADVTTIPDFRPFIGFPDRGRRYETNRLWPFFALRVMEPRRPDFREYVERLGLTPSAVPLDILSRSAGDRSGDAVQLVEEPRVAADGTTSTVFLVRGARFAAIDSASAHAAGDLQPGDQLTIAPESSNPSNPAALQMVTDSGVSVGWVPDMLIGYVNTIGTDACNVSLRRNNGPDSPWHMRLLVELAGHLPPTYHAFTGGPWPPRSHRHDLVAG